MPSMPSRFTVFCGTTRIWQLCAVVLPATNPVGLSSQLLSCYC